LIFEEARRMKDRTIRRSTGTLFLLALAAASTAWIRAAAAGGAASPPASPAGSSGPAPAGAVRSDRSDRVVRSDDEWRRILTPERYRILRKKGTEMSFTGEYWNNHDPGIFRCAGCSNPLFASETKYDSGTGWPSFWTPIAPDRVATAADHGLFSTRTEVLCRRCGGHLGHVFEDGPPPTGLRYCINSAALDLERRRAAAPPSPAAPARRRGGHPSHASEPSVRPEAAPRASPASPLPPRR
jgi:peptide-methionine (R)-S-oxide reductase